MLRPSMAVLPSPFKLCVQLRSLCCPMQSAASIAGPRKGLQGMLCAPRVLQLSVCNLRVTCPSWCVLVRPLLPPP